MKDFQFPFMVEHYPWGTALNVPRQQRDPDYDLYPKHLYPLTHFLPLSGCLQL